MTYIEFVLEFLNNQIVGEPIYTANITKHLSEKYNIDLNKASAAVAVTIKRIIDSNKLDNLRFYQKGIYYLTVQTPFGELGINKETLIQKKYILPDIGYETGYTALHRLGLTTQVPAERVLATNKAKDCLREDKNLDIYIRPPKIMITKQNKRYLQLLDVIELIDKAPIDAENPYEILAKYLKMYDIEYQQLLAFAERYYNKNTIFQIARIASVGGTNI